jgi:enolase-phosphatase E1
VSPQPVSARAVVTDIEGTVTPISFVKTTLFPYARERLPNFLHAHAKAPDVAEILQEVAAASGVDRADEAGLCAVLTAWMDRDAKLSPLKRLQGLIWQDGYRSGELQGTLFDDVAEALRRWRAAGLRLAVYSSGSVLAQKLLFSATPAGDLSSWFEDYFDTAVGGKKEKESYRRIAEQLRVDPQDALFLSDVPEELDAAVAAGMKAIQVVRAEDGTIASGRHPAVSSLSQLTLTAD